MKNAGNHSILGNFRQHAHQLHAGDHVVHFYDQHHTLMDCLCDYIVPSATRGDGIIIIAVPEHRQYLADQLEKRAIDVSKAQALGQLRFLDALDTLQQFMHDGHPLPQKFTQTIGPVIEEMQKKYPRITAYGEMVNILWQNGQFHGTVELEKLWNKLASKYKFSLLCGYHLNEHLERNQESLRQVKDAHTHIILDDCVFSRLQRDD